MLFMVYYTIHVVSAMAIIALILLPLRVLNLRSHIDTFHPGLLRPWRILLMLAQILLIVELATGLLMRPDFTSSWVWVVLVVFLLLGATTGMTTVALRQAQQSDKSNLQQNLDRLLNRSALTVFAVVAILVLMYLDW